MSRLKRPLSVTFDCWSTLITETDPGWGPARRARILVKHTDANEDDARAALAEAWHLHQVKWHRRVAFTARDMTAHALSKLGVKLGPPESAALLEELEAEALNHGIVALPGARKALEALAAAGIRRALVCDTGFSPGRIVRELLSRAGLLDLLEATVFSDEVGVPKPARLPFEQALAAIGGEPSTAAHVGDLRRSDVAGALAMGMGSIRITLNHDDADGDLGRSSGVIGCAVAGCSPPCARPEADMVARDYDEVVRALGVN